MIANNYNYMRDDENSTIRVKDFQNELQDTKHSLNDYLIRHNIIPPRVDPETKKRKQQEKAAKKNDEPNLEISDITLLSIESVASDYLTLERQLPEALSDACGGKANNLKIEKMSSDILRLRDSQCRGLETYNAAFSQQTALLQTAAAQLPEINDEQTLRAAFALARMVQLYTRLENIFTREGSSFLNQGRYDVLEVKEAAVSCLATVDARIKNYCKANNVDFDKEIAEMCGPAPSRCAIS